MGSGIYQIRNVKTGRVYVGSTRSFTSRRRTHFRELRRGNHHSPKLQASWDKHGEEFFVFEVLEECPTQDLILREQHWIDAVDAYGHGYNCRPFAESNRGRVWTQSERETHRLRERKPWTPEHKEAVRESIRERCTGHSLSEETREKIRQKRLGSKLTPEHRAKVIKTLSFKGRKHTEDSKERLREARARQVITKEHAAKVAEANRGKKRSEEQKRNISESLKGHTCSEETRRKIAETKRRKHQEKLKAQTA